MRVTNHPACQYQQAQHNRGDFVLDVMHVLAIGASLGLLILAGFAAKDLYALMVKLAERAQ